MEVKITINCDNAAFTPCVGDELARILHCLADKVCGLQPEEMLAKHGDRYNSKIYLLDVNGNRVGQVEINE